MTPTLMVVNQMCKSKDNASEYSGASWTPIAVHFKAENVELRRILQKSVMYSMDKQNDFADLSSALKVSETLGSGSRLCGQTFGR